MKKQTKTIQRPTGFISKAQYIALKKEGLKTTNEKFGKSLTEQDQAMSMRQIIAKYKILGSIPVERKTYYDSEHGINEFPVTENKDFDLVDFSDLSEKLQKEASELKKINDDNARKKAEEELNKKIDAEIAARQKKEEGQKLQKDNE